ncbi:mitochondrial 28S ribosomal protein S29-like protein [Citrus sinensis]|uniref:Mitochondrial 28S ribosomal protein S29-like protein n=1 Tax=Citrus sinensis TaxID=2711 RepID=A0ACB8JFM0_CITSI|nr:mitochondrial 28S ribosomal protein S29-like protein [Citrus sinensis]
MLRLISRAAAAAAALSKQRNDTVLTSTSILIHQFFYSTKTQTKSSKKKQDDNKKSSKSKSKSSDANSLSAPAAAQADSADDLESVRARARRLAEDDRNPSLDVGPNHRPLFTKTTSLSLLTRKDACTYFKFSEDELNAMLPEGLPTGMLGEFKDSMRYALLVRQSFLDIRDNFRRIVDPSLQSTNGPKIRKQIVLDGPLCCGKSITLAMLVHWAREEGWLVLYVPRGREWTHGGYFYKNPQTGLWDTPLQAENVLKASIPLSQDFIKYNESHLRELPCQILDPIPLGEGAGVGLLKGVDSKEISEGSTLFDLVQMGINQMHASVGVVVRLRKELSLVKDIPVLIAIDQVNAFRSMMHNDMMVGAFSHSTAVGKLRKDLPHVPVDARINLPRYSPDEAATVCHYYLRQRLVSREVFSEENWKKVYYLANGNGAEMRMLVPLMH